MTPYEFYEHFVEEILSLPPPLRFHFLFGIFVEFFPLVPILVGVAKWKNLTLGIKFFIGFLVAEVLFSGLTNYYLFVLDQKNLHLYYINSFLQSVFILTAFWYFLKKRSERIIILSLWCLCLALLVIDFVFVSKKDNYFSQFFINLIILGLSFYYFFTNFPHNDFKKNQFNETELILSAALVLQFFSKSVTIFLEKFLLETQSNLHLVLQVRNVNAYFVLLSLWIYSYAFYKLKINEA